MNYRILYLPSLFFSIEGMVCHDWRMLAIATLINAIAGVLR